MSAWMQAGIALAVAILAYLWLHALKAANSRLKTNKKIPKFIIIISVFVMLGRIMSALFGSEGEEFAVEIFPSNMTVFGMQLSSSIFYVWTIIGVVAVLAIVFRLFVVPRFSDSPKGIQNLLEISIESIDQYTHGKLHCSTQALACYFFSLVVLMVSSASLELLGIRPPTADLIMTFSMATITFCMINYYGIKEKGVKGRIKSLASPSAVILPIRILTDIAIPVSLACRLFGNMLGGMIVMDLLKIALGPNGIGLPPVAGLYFNVFHPLIQTYIFVTLSLTFINEAVE